MSSKELSNRIFLIYNTRTLFKNFVKKIIKSKNPVYKKFKKKLILADQLYFYKIYRFIKQMT
jgi:hypothetical protein